MPSRVQSDPTKSAFTTPRRGLAAAHRPTHSPSPTGRLQGCLASPCPKQTREDHPCWRFRPGPSSPGRLGHRRPGGLGPSSEAERREMAYLACGPCLVSLALDTRRSAPLTVSLAQGGRSPGRALASRTPVAARPPASGPRPGAAAVRGADRRAGSVSRVGASRGRTSADWASTRASG